MWPRRKSLPFISPCPPAIVMFWPWEYAATIFSMSTLAGERLDAGARGAREAIVALEHVGQSFGLDQLERLAQPDHDRHRRREADLVLRHVLQLVGETEVELRQGRGLGLAPGLLAERAESEARWQHQPLLRARHHQVDAPRVHRQVGNAQARYRVD